MNNHIKLILKQKENNFTVLITSVTYYLDVQFDILQLFSDNNFKDQKYFISKADTNRYYFLKY